jgi:hypothetical protein
MRVSMRSDGHSACTVDAPLLVLGVSTITRWCDYELPEHEHYTGLTLVPFGSEDRVLMARLQGGNGKGTDGDDFLRCFAENGDSIMQVIQYIVCDFRPNPVLLCLHVEIRRFA